MEGSPRGKMLYYPGRRRGEWVGKLMEETMLRNRMPCKNRRLTNKVVSVPHSWGSVSGPEMKEPGEKKEALSQSYLSKERK